FSSCVAQSPLEVSAREPPPRAALPPGIAIRTAKPATNALRLLDPEAAGGACGGASRVDVVRRLGGVLRGPVAHRVGRDEAGAGVADGRGALRVGQVDLGSRSRNGLAELVLLQVSEPARVAVRVRSEH